MDWKLNTNFGRAGDFLESLNFKVEAADDRDLVARRSSPSGGSVCYVVRILTDDDVDSAFNPHSFRFFKDRDGVEQRNHLLVPSTTHDRYHSYLEAQDGKSLLEQPTTEGADKMRRLADAAGGQDVQVGSFRGFLRQFVPLDELRDACLRSFQYHESKAYVRPVLEWGGGKKEDVQEFIEELEGSKRNLPSLWVIHGPGGRGKTALCEHITRELFKGLDNQGTPIPYLIKFEDHPGAGSVRALIRATLEDYGLSPGLNSAGVDRLIRYGVLTLILDGADELHEQAAETLRSENIKQLASKAHRNANGRILLTCRSTFLSTFPEWLPALTERSEHERLSLYELEEFDDDQIKRFLWQNAPAETDKERQSHQGRVIEFLNQQDRVKELAREPHLLEMMSARVATEDPGLPTIPQNLADVYDTFIEQICEREITRKSLPSDFAQGDYLMAVARNMVDLEHYALDREWIAAEIAGALDAYDGQAIPFSEEMRQELTGKLLDHYLLTSESLAGARLGDEANRIRFRHPTFRDYLGAKSLYQGLREGLSGHPARPLWQRRELPEDLLYFLSELLTSDDVERLRSTAMSTSELEFRNLIRLLMLWDDGKYFRSVLTPPRSLAGRSLDGLTLRGLDLSGYDLTNTVLHKAHFIDCNLSGCDLGAAEWNTLSFDTCTLRNADLGENPDRTMVIDGARLEDEALATQLREAGARGPGVRDIEPEEEEKDVTEILHDLFAKLVIGAKPEAVQLARRRPDSLSTGVLAPHAGFVQSKVIPVLLQRGYLAARGAHGALTIGRERLGEVVDYQFRDETSEDLSNVISTLETEYR